MTTTEKPKYNFVGVEPDYMHAGYDEVEKVPLVFFGVKDTRDIFVIHLDVENAARIGWDLVDNAARAAVEEG
ncbi:hypothetical protein [Mycobacteroides abscessus]|uniref:hypothetical protein n=1 Tax=Mycobacteroides abscessus TaxID=36809 RepID=UPI000C255C95|nr:hypothetical protein [Mycobacteroides abscessus]